MTVEFSPTAHDKGDPTCPACTTTGYPEHHECGGLVHATEADDDTQNSTTMGIILDCACDTCDMLMRRVHPYPEVEHEAKPKGKGTR